MIHKAIAFAARAHNGQTRKGSDTPYLVHPFEVALILQREGANDALVAAGLLHDTVEDAGITLEELKRVFGKETAQLVAFATEDKSLSWEERKTEAVRRAKAGTLSQQLLCCADKVSNLHSIQEDLRQQGELVWQKFRRGKEKQAAYYLGMREALSSLKGHGCYQELYRLVEEIFEER